MYLTEKNEKNKFWFNNRKNPASALKKKEDGLKQIKEEYKKLKKKINIITEKQKKKEAEISNYKNVIKEYFKRISIAEAEKDSLLELNEKIIKLTTISDEKIKRIETQNTALDNILIKQVKNEIHQIKNIMEYVKIIQRENSKMRSNKRSFSKNFIPKKDRENNINMCVATEEILRMRK